MKLLIVEDDEELSRQLRTELTEMGYQVMVESDGNSGLAAAVSGVWDLAIIDVSLPGLSGFDLVKQVREKGVAAPIIFLTARVDISDRVNGLSLGGDDYLTKPFSMDELKARLIALNRRYTAEPSKPVPLPPGWSLNPLLRQVTVDEDTVSLQPREWSLLDVFLKHEGDVLTNSFLLDLVWGIRFDPGTNVVDAALCRLRRKLDRPAKPSHIETIRGRGHIFRRHV